MHNKRENAALFIPAIVGMLVFISLFSGYTTTLDAFQIELRLVIFDHGYTQLELPPLGLVRARTHFPPLMFRVALVNINLDLLQKVVEKADDQGYLDRLTAAARRETQIFLARLLVLAFTGGVAGPFIFGERRRKSLISAGVIALILLGLFLAVSYATFNHLAFLTPEFEGILEAAPWMFGLVEETLVRVRSLSGQLQLIAENISLLYEQVERLGILGTVQGDLVAAHISDLHNNPAGMDFVRQVIDTFNVDLVIDTGDITDFGTELEAGLAAPIEEFGIPYIFIPGNHDSPNVIARMKNIPNVVVLEEGLIEVSGLRIAGIADPSSRHTGMAVAPDYVLDDYAERLERVVLEAKMRPHIAAAHHPRIAGRLLDQVPLVLTGHTHQFEITEQGGSVMINAGTTGASGIRGLQARRETPYSLVLLHFQRTTDNDLYLRAADIIRVFKLQSGFSLERRLFGSVSEDTGERPE